MDKIAETFNFCWKKLLRFAENWKFLHSRSNLFLWLTANGNFAGIYSIYSILIYSLFNLFFFLNHYIKKH